MAGGRGEGGWNKNACLAVKVAITEYAEFGGWGSSILFQLSTAPLCRSFRPWVFHSDSFMRGEVNKKISLEVLCGEIHLSAKLTFSQRCLLILLLVLMLLIPCVP